MVKSQLRYGVAGRTVLLIAQRYINDILELVEPRMMPFSLF